MNVYYATRMRFQPYQQQLKALLAFSGILLPMFALVVWARLHVAVLFHTLLLAMGWLSWTFFEYMLHRFFQHKETTDHRHVMLNMHQNHHLHPTEIHITAGQRIYMLLILMIGSVTAVYLHNYFTYVTCLLYTSDAADERSSVDLGGRRIIK